MRDPLGRNEFWLKHMRPAWEWIFSWIFPVPIVSKAFTRMVRASVFPAYWDSCGVENKELSNLKTIATSYDGVEIKGKVGQFAREGNATLIIFPGNGVESVNFNECIIPNIRETDKISKEVQFFPRGVGATGGVPYSHDDLVADAIAVIQAQVQDLKKKKPAGTLVLYGHSLGGTIATRSARYFEDHKEELGDVKIKLILDRSLTSPMKIKNWFLLKPLVWLVLKISGFYFDIENDLKKLSKSNNVDTLIIDSNNDRIVGRSGRIGANSNSYGFCGYYEFADCNATHLETPQDPLVIKKTRSSMEVGSEVSNPKAEPLQNVLCSFISS